MFNARCVAKIGRIVNASGIHFVRSTIYGAGTELSEASKASFISIIIFFAAITMKYSEILLPRLGIIRY